MNIQLSNNEFLHGSGNAQLTKENIVIGTEGFHVTKSIDVAKDRCKINKYTKSYIYKITTVQPLNSLIFAMDIDIWNSQQLARFFRAAYNFIHKLSDYEIGGGYDFDLDGNAITIADWIPDLTKLAILDIKLLYKIEREPASSTNLAKLFAMLDKLGYNSIQYTNQAEWSEDTLAYILFGNKNINTVELLNL